MVFSSFTFLWIFLPTVLLLYYLIKSIFFRNLLLCVVSFVFYAWGEPVYVILMILSTLFNFLVGKQVAKYKNMPQGKSILTLGIAVNLLGLGYFKYLGFLVENINYLFSLKLNVNPVILPIGISFYTFHCISYIVDVYKTKTDPQRNLLKMGLYISFFPQLVAGPIIKYHDINQQLDYRTHTFKKFNNGVRRFVQGLVKKVLIANTLGKMADYAFNQPSDDLSSIMALVGIFSYTFQIYYDFSGYSDMAIGLAQMFGFRFNENFRRPYSSTSIKEFWRKWHISLSTWFRDYLYIPLGGNRVSTFRQYLNLGLVFFATGLWHGASWNFVFWGLWHGSFLILEKFISINSVLKFNVLKKMYVMTVVSLGWIFFRADSFKHGWEFTKRLLFYKEAKPLDLLQIQNKEFLFFSLIGIGLSGLITLPQSYKVYAVLRTIRRSSGWLYYLILIYLCIIYLAGSTHNPFIYFRF